MSTSSPLLPQGTRVWVNDSSLGWIQGVVTQHQGVLFRVQIEGNEEDLVYNENQVIELHEGSLGDYEDMVKIDDLNEAVLLHNLAQRYERDQIYTRIGSVIVCLNPFRVIEGLYGPEKCRFYKENTNQQTPHIYQISCFAYKNLRRNGKSQAILVSGESGAGKTEAAKSILQCLAVISSEAAEIGHIERKILQSNPILEAFGNARTVCNNNSSRFGKFIQVAFSRKGQIRGAIIDTYLLEKSRIAWQAPNERNYHVFYQLIRGGSPETRNKFSLTEHVEDYHFLHQSGCVAIPGVDDKHMFAILLEALDNVGIDEGEQENIFAVLAAVLHLGNIRFQPRAIASPDHGNLEIVNMECVETVSYLLGVSKEFLEKSLLVREFRGAGRGSVYTIPLELPQAQEARDALAKELYSRLFNLLVCRINSHLQDAPGTSSTELRIGVLDIFGFEIFEKNSFEQLLINFANEKLQCQFNQSMFAMEQEEYSHEGISWDAIDFTDNQICVDLIENKPFGVLPMLDEECQVPKGSEAKLLEKLTQRHKESSLFHAQRDKQGQGGSFSISHFAGSVEYRIDHFLEKNKDTLPQDIQELLSSSHREIIVELFPQTEETQNRSARRSDRKLSVAQSFSKQLSSLMKTLAEMEQHYIRCIKPNPSSVPQTFDSLYSLRQLRCAGLMDTVRIRKAGFAYRRSFAEFLKRFGLLPLSQCPNWATLEPATACKTLLAAIQSEHSDFTGWTLGHSKVFLKSNEIALLDQMLAHRFRSAVMKIENVWRRALRIRKWTRLLHLLQEQDRKSKQAEEERKKKQAEEAVRLAKEEERKKEEAARVAKTKPSDANQETNKKLDLLAWEQQMKANREKKAMASPSRKETAPLPTLTSTSPRPASKSVSDATSQPEVVIRPTRGGRGRGRRTSARGKPPPPPTRSPNCSVGSKQEEPQNRTYSPYSGSAPSTPTASRTLDVPLCHSPHLEHATIPPPLVTGLPPRAVIPPSLTVPLPPSLVMADPKPTPQGPPPSAVGFPSKPPPATVGPPPPPPPATVGPPPPPATVGPPPRVAEASESAHMTPGSKRGRGRGRGRGVGVGRASVPTIPPYKGDNGQPLSLKVEEEQRSEISPRIQSVKIQALCPSPRLQKQAKNLPKPNTGFRNTAPGNAQLKQSSNRHTLKSSISADSLPRSPKLANERDDGLLAVVSTKIPKIELSTDNTEMHRQQVMHEFLITEKGYLDDMYTLIEVFLNPLRQKDILSKAELVNLFCNIESIISVNVQFFRKCLEHLDQFVEEKDFPLGKIFLESMNFFKLYTEYCLKQPIAFVKLEEAQKKNSSFNDFLKFCEGDPRCRGLFLNSFLIKPTQRICKYPLLLKDILKHTPEDHSDYDSLSQSLEQVKQLLDFINERKREGEATSKMLSINDKLEGYNELLLPSRKLILDALLDVKLKKKDKPQEMRVFLFNDLILIVKERKNSYEYRRSLHLASSKVTNLAEMFKASEDSFSWEMRDSNKKETTSFTCKSFDEKVSWMKAIQKFIKEYQREKFKEMNEKKK